MFFTEPLVAGAAKLCFSVVLIYSVALRSRDAKVWAFGVALFHM